MYSSRSINSLLKISSGENESDAVNTSADRKSRPNPFNLASRDNADDDSENASVDSADGNKGASNGLYRPPRIQAAPFKVRGNWDEHIMSSNSLV